MDRGFSTLPLRFSRREPAEMAASAEEFKDLMALRRSVRHFATDPIPLDVVRDCIAAACTAPSGANKQPYTFCLVTDPDIKRAIRHAAEREEYENYHGRMPAEWVRELEPLGTDYHKPHLEEAPALIVVLRKSWEPEADGTRARNYYVAESTGIAVGFLIAALHQAGLACLTHTPAPMDFVARILGRPDHEKAYLLLPVGYPTSDCQVPDIQRKALTDLLVEYP
jgi:iodotyrosine deiodinase